MSEEIKSEEVVENEMINNEEVENQVEDQDFDDLEEESYQEAVKAQEEEESAGKKTKVPRLKIEGTKTLRIAPLAPGTVKRQTGKRFGADRYRMPQRSILLPIEIEGRDKPLYVSVNSISQFDEFEGLYDVITTYMWKAKDALEKAGREDEAEIVTGNSYGGGLKYDFKNHVYAFADNKDGDNVLHQVELTGMLSRQLEKAKMLQWEKWGKKGLDKKCPISSINDACLVDIIKGDSKPVTYTINIDTEENVPLTDEMKKAIKAAPRLDKIVHYSRYQFEATKFFLKAYDAKFGLSVCESEEFIKACDAVDAVLTDLKDETKFDPTKYAKKESGKKDSDKSSATEEAKIDIEDLIEGILKHTEVDSFSELVDMVEAEEDVEIDESYSEVKSFRRNVVSQFIKENDLSIKPLRAAKYPTPKLVVDVYNEVNN